MPSLLQLIALREAAKTNDTEVMQLLIDHGVDLNGMTYYPGCALITAIRRRAYDATRMLLDHGANVNIRVPEKPNDDVKHPLVLAVISGDIKNVEDILVNWILNSISEYDLSRALRLAIENREEEMFDLLCKYDEIISGWNDLVHWTCVCYERHKSRCPMYSLSRLRAMLQLEKRLINQPGSCHEEIQNLNRLYMIERSPDDLDERFIEPAGPHDCQCTPLQTAMHLFCRPDHDTIQELLDRGASLRASEEDWYLISKECELLQSFIDRGFTFNDVPFILYRTTLDLYLEQGVPINKFEDKFKSDQTLPLLLSACSWNNVDTLKLVIEKGASVRLSCLRRGTGLHLLSRMTPKEDVLEIVNILTEGGLDIDCDHTELGSPLYNAVLTGNIEKAALLLELGANPNFYHRNGCSVVQAAAHMDMIGYELLQILIQYGAEIRGNPCGLHGVSVLASLLCGGSSPQTSFQGHSAIDPCCSKHDGALAVAAHRKCLAAVQCFLKIGADPNAHPPDRPTPLQYAVASVYVWLSPDQYAGFEGIERSEEADDCVQELIEAGADVNAASGELLSPLAQACGKLDLEMAERLSENNLDPNAGIEESQITPLQALMLAIKLALTGTYDAYEDMLNWLLDHGASVTKLGGRYHSPLQALVVESRPWMAQDYHRRLFQRLIELGADINAQGGMYHHVLQAAVVCNLDETLLRFLIEQGADINALGGEYGSALQAAVYIGDHTVVDMLLAAGADPNSPPGQHGTALEIAVSVRDIRMYNVKGMNGRYMFRQLMKAGARMRR